MSTATPTRKSRSLTPRSGDDSVQTPPELARLIVEHFRPSGWMLDPCRGEGAFYQAMDWSDRLGNVDWCEITQGKDFLNGGVSALPRFDWIVTNPPFSQFRPFLRRAMEVADNIVFLSTVNHFLALKARQRDMEQAGFGIVEVLRVPTPPKPWPQSGFTLGAGWFRRGWTGAMSWSDLKEGKG